MFARSTPPISDPQSGVALNCLKLRLASHFFDASGGAECSLKQIRILPWLPTKGEVRGQGQRQSHGGYHQF